MKSFEEWFSRPLIKPNEKFLLNGLWERPNGKIMCECRMCGKVEEFPGDEEDALTDDEDDQYVHYCGGSPQCCP